LSRLGRKLTETLILIQETFLLNGIRFISIQEGYDSADPYKSNISLLLSAVGMFNEMHCEITSAKTKEALRTRAENGKFIGSKPPYGYLLDPLDKYHLIVDDEASEVVRRIFNLACEGHGFKSIAGIMRREGILNPTAYVNLKNPSHHEKSEYWSRDHDWHASSISTMLNNYSYLGHLYYGRRGKLSWRLEKIVRQDEENWIKMLNTHEPIITQETWDLAHTVLSRKTKSCHNNAPKQIFAGLLKCSDCGYSLSYTKSSYSKSNNHNDKGNYKCSTYNVKGKDYCSIHYISYNDIYQIVLEEIREKAAIAVSNRDWFMRELLKSMNAHTINRQKGDKTRLVQIEKEKTKLECRLSTLYDDRADGTINKEQFKYMFDKTNVRISELTQEQLTLTAKLSIMSESVDKTTSFLNIITEYDNIQELNAATLNRLIERIIIGNKVSLGGKKYSQDIIIQFRFIGAINVDKGNYRVPI
jgi:DNA invertase Pin-like site-specific DNA recombinase